MFPTKMSIVQSIRKALEDRNTVLRKIQIQKYALDPQFVQIIFKVLGKNRFLEKIILSDGALNKCQPTMFTELFKRIQSASNSSLAYLDISHNSVIDRNDDVHEAIIQELIEI